MGEFLAEGNWIATGTFGRQTRFSANDSPKQKVFPFVKGMKEFMATSGRVESVMVPISRDTISSHLFHLVTDTGASAAAFIKWKPNSLLAPHASTTIRFTKFCLRPLPIRFL